MNLKISFIIVLSILSSTAAYSKGIIVLRCSGLETKAANVKLFQITLAESELEKNPEKILRDSSEVRVIYKNGQKAFATENVLFRSERGFVTKFLIGIEDDFAGEFIRLDRDMSAKGTTYKAQVLKNMPLYDISAGQSSNCKVTSKQ